MLSPLSISDKMVDMPAADAPRTARDRARAELTAEIKEVARRHIAEQGASALSLRAVARELGMVSSALYRYFPSRDDLLTALIIDAYDAVGAVAEASEASSGDADTAVRWIHLAGAIRGWAVANPQEYALIYGSPVPGYAAPTDTVDPATRVSAVFLRLVVDGVAVGEIADGGALSMPRVVRSDLRGLRDALAPDVSDLVLARGLFLWTQLFGGISFELFGHQHGLVTDADAFFDVQIRRSAALLVGR